MNKKGFTLIEITVGLVILAIGLLAFVGIQISSTKGNFKSRYLTQASYIVQDGLEYLENLPISSPQLQEEGLHDDDTVTVSGIVFNRSYTVDADDDRRTIRYTVRWNDGVDRTITFTTIRSR